MNNFIDSIQALKDIVKELQAIATSLAKFIPESESEGGAES